MDLDGFELTTAYVELPNGSAICVGVTCASVSNSSVVLWGFFNAENGGSRFLQTPAEVTLCL